MPAKTSISITRSSSDSGRLHSSHRAHSASHPSPGEVHRREARGTDLADQSKGRVSPPRMARSPGRRRGENSAGNMNKSVDSVHAGPLSAKHRRLVGGESVGSEYIPGEPKPEPAVEELITTKPPLNPSPVRNPEPRAQSPIQQPVSNISEFARATNVIYEGYLDKKSQILGLWQKVSY